MSISQPFVYRLAPFLWKHFIESKSFPEYLIDFEEIEVCVNEDFCALILSETKATFRCSSLVFSRGFLVLRSWWIAEFSFVFKFSDCVVGGSSFTTFSFSNNFTCLCNPSFLCFSTIVSLNFFRWIEIFESSAFLFCVCLTELNFHNYY